MRQAIAIVAAFHSFLITLTSAAACLPDQWGPAFIASPRQTISNHRPSKCPTLHEKRADGIAESGVFEHGFESDLDERMESLDEQYQQFQQMNEGILEGTIVIPAPPEEDVAEDLHLAVEPKKNEAADYKLYGFVRRGDWAKP